MNGSLAPPHATIAGFENLGITVRKTADIIIGTYCIERGHALLHDYRDFAPMETHLGLKVA